MRTLILCKCDGVHFGIWQAGRTVRLNAGDLHWLPSSSPHVAGLTIINNRTITLFDLSACLGLSPVSRDEEQYAVLLFQSRRSTGGFVLPRHIQKGRVSGKTLKRLPDYIRSPIQSHWLSLPEGPVPVIETVHLFNKVTARKFSPLPPNFFIKDPGPGRTDIPPRFCSIKAGGFEFALANNDLNFRPAEDRSIHPIAAVPGFFSGITVVGSHLLPVIRLAAILELDDGDPVQEMLIARICGAYFGFEIGGKEAGGGAGRWVVRPLPGILRTPWMQAAAVDGPNLFPILELSSLLATVARPRYPKITPESKDTGGKGEFASAYKRKTIEILEFDINGQRHALPKSDVVSVLDFEPYQPLPVRNQLIAGMAGCADDIVPVIDLAACYGSRSRPQSEWHMIQVKNGPSAAYVLAEHIAGPRNLDPKVQHELPYEDDTGVVYGCYPADGAVRLILNIHALMTRFGGARQSDALHIFRPEIAPQSAPALTGPAVKASEPPTIRQRSCLKAGNSLPVNLPVAPPEEKSAKGPGGRRRHSSGANNFFYPPHPEDGAMSGPWQPKPVLTAPQSAVAVWLTHLQQYFLPGAIGNYKNLPAAVSRVPALPEFDSRSGEVIDDILSGNPQEVFQPLATRAEALPLTNAGDATYRSNRKNKILVQGSVPVGKLHRDKQGTGELRPAGRNLPAYRFPIGAHSPEVHRRRIEDSIPESSAETEAIHLRRVDLCLRQDCAAQAAGQEGIIETALRVPDDPVELPLKASKISQVEPVEDTLAGFSESRFSRPESPGRWPPAGSEMPPMDDTVESGDCSDCIAAVEIENTQVSEPETQGILTEFNLDEDPLLEASSQIDTGTHRQPLLNFRSVMLAALLLVGCLAVMLHLFGGFEYRMFWRKDAKLEMPVTPGKPALNPADHPEVPMPEAHSAVSADSQGIAKQEEKSAEFDTAVLPRPGTAEQQIPAIRKVIPIVTPGTGVTGEQKEKSDKAQESKIDFFFLSDHDIAEAVKGGVEEPDLVIVVEQAPNNSLEPALPVMSPLNSKDIIIHKVKKGDTLWDISKRYTGTGFSYPKVAEKNKIHNPHRIYPGQKIWIIKRR